MKFTTVFVVSLLCASGLSAQAPACPPPISHIDVANGSFSSQPGVSFNLRHFRATLLPMGRTAPSCYQRITAVTRAEIFVSNESLTNLFSQKLKAAHSKISGFKVRNGPSTATLTGNLRHVLPVHFSIEGPVTTNGSELRLDAKVVKADGIPIKLLLEIGGAELNSVVQVKGVPGLAIEENAITFSPERVAHLKGHIASVTTSPEGLTLRYTPLQ